LLGTLRSDARTRETTLLDDLNRLIDWEGFGPTLTSLYPAEGGRPALDPVGMLKLVFVQRLYNLSDEEAVRQLNDRRSFERFVGLDGLDSSSLTRFRKRLSKAGVGLDALLDGINTQIAAHGYRIASGSIVDASLIPSRHRPDAVWQSGPHAGEVIDPDVGLTVRDRTDRSGQTHRTVHRGMKLHARCSTDGLIQRVRVTRNTVHDTKLFAELVESGPPCEKLYADRGYDSHANRTVLYRHKTVDGIMRKRRNGKRSPAARNRRLAKTRGRIEGIWGVMKRTTTASLRYRGAETNRVQATVDSIVYNLKRFIHWKTGLAPALYLS
ncbi:MAG: IS5 family transposase, partial [Thermoanaerobaculia bacterium]